MNQAIIVILIIAAVALFAYLLRRQTKDETCEGCPVRSYCKSNRPAPGCTDALLDHDTDKETRQTDH